MTIHFDWKCSFYLPPVFITLSLMQCIVFFYSSDIWGKSHFQVQSEICGERSCTRFQAGIRIQTNTADTNAKFDIPRRVSSWKVSMKGGTRASLTRQCDICHNTNFGLFTSPREIQWIRACIAESSESCKKQTKYTNSEILSYHFFSRQIPFSSPWPARTFPFPSKSK